MTLLLAVTLPVLLGALLPVFKWKTTGRNLYLMAATLATSALVAYSIFSDLPALSLISLNNKLSISLRLDGLGRVFSGLVALL